MKALLPLALAATLGALAVPAAHAEGADSWVVRVGGAVVAPKGNNGTLAGARADVSSSTRPTIDLEYMFTPNWGVDVLGAWPFQHDVKLAGLGTVARTMELPPTVGINYHFMPDAAWSPFVGAGVNYTNFYSTHGTGALYGSSVSIANSWGPAARVGFDMKISDKWLATVDVRWAYIESDVKVDGTKVGKAKIDPIVFGASVGYRF
ncbi:OmpW/AlkL family protein [Dyella japonica]|uniref:Membrane protein n=1 Tax=Dyella japonica A8 TaxID=1217721 RepID=A0A075JW26_9GAMM|nr:OmpW family outer membrane protein [Dyella japonica]AIF46316.1 membrane protein [Dyella japonica A8]